MQRTFNPLAAALVAVAVALGTVACSSTATRQSAGEYVDDAALTARVKTALVKADDVDALAINVETYRGVVSLSGFVDSEAEAARAVSAAHAVSGVRSVKNDMRVKPAS